jgi:membrane protease YdiL (CAAX protease family)
VGGQVVSGILLFVSAAVNGQASNLAQLASRRVPPSWVVISGLVGLWIGFLGAVFLTSRVRGTGSVRHDFGLEIRARDIVLGPLIGLAGQLILLRLLYLPLEHVIPHLNDKLSQPAKHITGGFPGSDLAVIAALTVVVVPVVEELFFRGLILRALVRIFARAGPVIGPTLAVVSSGIVFGLAHFQLLQLLGLAAFGVVLSVMAYKFRRLGPSIFAHATFNLLAILSVAFPSGLLR